MKKWDSRNNKFERKKKQKNIPYVEPKIAYFYFKGSGIEIFQNSNLVTQEVKELSRNFSEIRFGYTEMTPDILYLSKYNSNNYDFDSFSDNQRYNIKRKICVRRGLRRIKLINETV